MNFTECNATAYAQSPINITHEGTYYHDWLESSFSFIGEYRPVPSTKVVRDNGFVNSYVLNTPDNQFNGNWAAEPKYTHISQRQVKWRADEARFHWPSEHALNGTHYDLEMQVHHTVSKIYLIFKDVDNMKS